MVEGRDIRAAGHDATAFKVEGIFGAGHPALRAERYPGQVYFTGWGLGQRQ
jgi:hypothetical protein